MKKDERQLLPIVRINGWEFLVDVENRQFRNFRNSDEVIKMHSQQGRQMICADFRLDINLRSLSSLKTLYFLAG